MKGLQHVYGLFALLMLSACLQAQEPAWINGGGMDGYRGATFLTATGEGASREQARKHAIARLAEQLKVSISSQSDISQQFQSSENESSSSESMNIQINTQVDLEGVEGVQIVDQYYQPASSTYFAFAVLDKEQGASKLAFAIESQFDQIRRAQKAAQQLISAGKPGEGLRKLLKASYLFESIDRDIQLHRLFARAGMNSLLKSERSELAQQFERYASQVFDAVQVQVVGNSQQAGSPELGVRDPFRVRFSYNGSVLAGVPVKVLAEDAGTVIDADSSTDSRGELAVRIRSFPYTGKARNKITVKLDFDERAINIPAPGAQLFIQLSQKSEVSILLKSKITNRFNDFLYLTVNDGLSSILSEQNYHVVTADEGYAGNTDYVVSVQANAVALPGYGGIQFVKFNGVVGVRSNQTGRMLKTIRINSEATKAGGLSLEVAAEKAAAKLVDAVRNDLLQTLEKNLGRQ